MGIHQTLGPRAATIVHACARMSLRSAVSCWDARRNLPFAGARPSTGRTGPLPRPPPPGPRTAHLAKSADAEGAAQYQGGSESCRRGRRVGR